MENRLGPFEDPAMVRRLVDDGMVLFFALDGGGTITWIGRSCEPMLGHPASELLGANALDLVHPDDQEILVGSLADTVRDSEARILTACRVRHADGRWLNLEFSGLDLRDQSGAGTFLIWGRTHESAFRLMTFLSSLLTADDESHLVQQVVEWCDALMPYSASVVLARSDDGTYRSVAAAGALPLALGDGLVVDSETIGPWHVTLNTGALVAASVSEVSDVLAAEAREAAIFEVWIVPVPGADGALPDGLLVSWRLRPGPPSTTHHRHLEEASRLCQLAFQWADRHHDLVAAATTDSLTGVANRIRLRERVASDRSRAATVLYCDLDRFKELNDRHGHAVGDEVLRAVALRMRAAVRSTDLLVRLGGDEFVVWCPGLHDPRAAGSVAQTIIDALTEPVVVDGTAHRVGCSIGVASTALDDGAGLDLDALIGRADRALYEAKAAGRSRWVHALV